MTIILVGIHPSENAGVIAEFDSIQEAQARRLELKRILPNYVFTIETVSHDILQAKLTEAQRKLDLVRKLSPHLRIDCALNPSWAFCSQCSICEFGEQVKKVLEES